MSLVGLVGGDARVVDAHDRAVAATLAWIEKNAAETRLKDPATGRMVREGGQKMVAATFRHDTSRNLDPQLHTHAVIANMVQGEDGKWRSMANEKLYESKMLIGAIYRSELARGLSRLGYGIEKTHSDGRFEIAGVWQRQAADLGFDAPALTAEAAAKGAEREGAGRDAAPGAAAPETGQRGVSRDAGRSVGEPVLEGGTDKASSGRDRGTESVPKSAAARAVEWAVAHLSEREAVFFRTDLLAAVLAWDPGEVTVGEAEAALAEREQGGSLHAARMPGMDGLLTTDRVSFRLEDGRMLDMSAGDPQLGHIDRAWTSTVHAFQGRTVDNVIAAIEANHPNLTNQKMLYVEISRARDRAELVIDDKAVLKVQLEALTGERIAALEALGGDRARASVMGAAREMSTSLEGTRPGVGRAKEAEKTSEPKTADRDLGL